MCQNIQNNLRMFQQTDVKVKEKISKIPFVLMSDGVTRNIKQELVMLVAVLSVRLFCDYFYFRFVVGSW